MKEIKELRKHTGLSQVKFSEALHIPKRTLEDWEAGKRCCPPYVFELIEYRIDHDDTFRKSEK